MCLCLSVRESQKERERDREREKGSVRERERERERVRESVSERGSVIDNSADRSPLAMLSVAVWGDRASPRETEPPLATVPAHTPHLVGSPTRGQGSRHHGVTPGLTPQDSWDHSGAAGSLQSSAFYMYKQRPDHTHHKCFS